MNGRHLFEYLRLAKAAGVSSERTFDALCKAGWEPQQVVGMLFEHVHGSMPIDDAENVIVARNVRKSFGDVEALRGASLTAKKGAVTALLGPNGAGKTTLVRAMTTLLRPDTGEIRIAGVDAVRNPQKLREIIGLTGQYAAVDEILTGRENLEMVGRLYHFSANIAKRRAAELLREFDLEDAADRSVKTYSGGMRRRLDLAASLMNRPQVLFLDEPTTGLDPRSRLALWHMIEDLVAGGTTVLLTTQYLEEADQLADMIYVVDHGEIIARGTPEELKRNVGGDVLELHMMTNQDAERAVAVLKTLSNDQARVNPEIATVTFPISNGASVLVEAVRLLDGAGLAIKDIHLRRPTLDDVFLKLTGRAAEEGVKQEA